MSLDSKSIRTAKQKDPDFDSVRLASEKLLDALTKNATDQTGAPISLKLCLEAREYEDTICLDLVFCRLEPLVTSTLQ